MTGKKRKRWGAKAIDIGKRIAELRNYRNISQRAMAPHLGISQSQLAKYEIGMDMPDVDMLEKMAVIFGVNPCKLVGWCDD